MTTSNNAPQEAPDPRRRRLHQHRIITTAHALAQNPFFKSIIADCPCHPPKPNDLDFHKLLNRTTTDIHRIPTKDIIDLAARTECIIKLALTDPYIYVDNEAEGQAALTHARCILDSAMQIQKMAHVTRIISRRSISRRNRRADNQPCLAG